LAKDIMQFDRMNHGVDASGVDIIQDANIIKNCCQVAKERFDLGVRHFETGEASNLTNVLVRQLHSEAWQSKAPSRDGAVAVETDKLTTSFRSFRQS
jgi:hypothetical protein